MRLKELRLMNKYTQKEIAEKIHITQFTYSNYETETTQPTIETLCKLADQFHVSFDYLVGRNFTNEVGYLTEQQVQFVNAFLKLTEANQINALIYVSGLLANQ